MSTSAHSECGTIMWACVWGACGWLNRSLKVRYTVSRGQLLGFSSAGTPLQNRDPRRKPRDSARPALLLTAVRSRLSGLAVHPRRVLHGPAAPDWRGEHE